MENDSVFATKESLIVDFVPRKNDPKASLQLEYDIVLAGLDEPGQGHVLLEQAAYIQLNSYSSHAIWKAEGDEMVRANH